LALRNQTSGQVVRIFADPRSAITEMTLDKSLKVRAGAIKTRNVMTRAERIKRLQDLDKWTEESIVLGMAKVRVPKISLKKKKKVKKEDEADDKKKKKK